MTVALLALSFVLIVLGALAFTNAVEWCGVRLKLGEGAVGGLLAAVGTALPESLIPLIALIGGEVTEERRQIAIGAIIGAPFLLGTLAMLLIAGAAYVFRARRQPEGILVHPVSGSAERDLIAFVVLFPVAIVVGAIGAGFAIRAAVAAALIGGYGIYVWRTIRGGGDRQRESQLHPLFFDASKRDPPSGRQIAAQLIVSLGAIILGAELFVGEVEQLALSAGISVLIVALILAPLATELPEKINSVLWMREGKDTLALGNVSGAMCFQATIPVSIGLLLTPWELDRFAIAAALAGLAGALVALWGIRRGRFSGAPSVLWALLLGGFLIYAVLG